MIKPVLTIGDPRLGSSSEPIGIHEFNTPWLNSLIDDLVDTAKFKQGVGIAGVQIGVLKRIAIIEYDTTNTRYSNIGSCPLTVVINPEIEPVGNELSTLNEGCLSVPVARGDVTRYKKLKYRFYDQYGNLHTGTRDDFFVRVLQHELDHMNGIVFPMRISGEVSL